MRRTPSWTVRRSRARAACGSSGRRMAPNPSRFTVRSPPRENVPARAASVLLVWSREVDMAGLLAGAPVTATWCDLLLVGCGGHCLVGDHGEKRHQQQGAERRGGGEDGPHIGDLGDDAGKGRADRRGA